MHKKINVALVYGGKSGEHEISLLSACSILKNLDSNKYNIIPIGIDKNGYTYLNDYNELLSSGLSLPIRTENSRYLNSLFVDGKFVIETDVVFPIAHGPLYEDGCLQGLLKLADVAFVGCDVLASAIGMDKDIARRLLTQDIRYTDYRVLSWNVSLQDKQQFCHEVIKELGWPLFVKPCTLGSSVGMHKVNTMLDLTTAIDDALRYDDSILVERAIVGREIEVAVLENSISGAAPRVSAPGEICVHHTDGFYSYAAKYIDIETTTLVISAQLSPAIVEQLQFLAKKIFVILKCQGMARIDFFVNEQTAEIYFSEINTIPGFTVNSMYPLMWQDSGLSYVDLLDELINLACTHHQRRKKLVTNYR